MFANKNALETLVNSDTKATSEEKLAVLLAIRGELDKVNANTNAQVLSIADAAKRLGKTRKSIYHLLRTGTLKGFYSGKTHSRATGITLASLEAAVHNVRRDAE